jgi:hypothetical protein
MCLGSATATTPRAVTGAGAVEVVAPRVNDRRVDEVTGERRRFSSAILPPWCRKSPKVAEVLPLLYLHGLSGNDFTPRAGAVPRLPRLPWLSVLDVRVTSAADQALRTALVKPAMNRVANAHARA